MKTPYLYHGSKVTGLDVLVPKQARNGSLPDPIDGKPAVFATRSIEHAIFMALIGSNRWGGWSPKKYGGRGFYIHEEFLDYLTSPEYEATTGAVYFLRREDFIDESDNDYRAYSPVTVLGSFAVDVSDLPGDIVITEEPHPARRRVLAENQP